MNGTAQDRDLEGSVKKGYGAVEFALQATHVLCALLFLSAIAFLFD